MNAKTLAVLIYLVINFKSCQGVKYRGYTLLTMTPVTKDQLKYLRNLNTEKYMDVAFCEKPYKVGQAIDMIVSPNDLPLFNERAEHFNLNYRVSMNDIQGAFDKQSVLRYQTRRPENFSFEHFHEMDDIYHWLTDLSHNASIPLEHTSIGKSNEGRDISVANINFDTNLRTKNSKPKVLIEGGIHGHEWPSVAFVTYLINELARADISKDHKWRKFARAYDWYLIPVLNPDGFDYTHKVERLWKKNRHGRNNSVNLNRNFDNSFGTFDSSSDPNNDYYSGPKPFSEPESRALLSFIWPMRKELKYYFAIHSYGQRIIIPYEDRIPHLENFDEMENYARQAIRKLFLRDNTKFSTGTVYDLMGARMSGTSTSWAKKEMKINYVYTIQVRDTGATGVALPCDQLRPMYSETKLIIQELMTTKPKLVRALYADDDANINSLYIPFMLLTFVVTLK